MSNTMSEETGLRFEFQPGSSAEGSAPAILLTSALPWCFCKAGGRSALDAADRVMSAYMAELGIPGYPGDVMEDVA